MLGADDVIGKSWQVSTPIHDEDIVTIEKDPGSSRASLQRFSFNAVLATCVCSSFVCALKTCEQSFLS